MTVFLLVVVVTTSLLLLSSSVVAQSMMVTTAFVSALATNTSRFASACEQWTHDGVIQPAKAGCDSVVASTRVTGEEFTSAQITFSNFNITLPAGASIRGIEFDIRRAVTPIQLRGTVEDEDVLVNSESFDDAIHENWSNISASLRSGPFPSPQDLRIAFIAAEATAENARGATLSFFCVLARFTYSIAVTPAPRTTTTLTTTTAPTTTSRPVSTTTTSTSISTTTTTPSPVTTTTIIAPAPTTTTTTRSAPNTVISPSTTTVSTSTTLSTGSSASTNRGSTSSGSTTTTANRGTSPDDDISTTTTSVSGTGSNSPTNSANNLQGSPSSAGMSVDGEEIAGWIIPVAVVCGVLLLIMCIAFIVFAYKKGQQSALSSGGGTVEMVTARPQATAPSAAQGSTPTTAASEYSAYGIGGIDAQNESVSSGGEAYGVLPSSDGDGPRAYGILPGTSDDGYVPLRT